MDAPSTASPQLQTLIYTVLRALLTITGALGIGIGANMSDGNLMIIAGALATIGGVVWSIWQKIAAARDAHSRAVASAAAGAPVKPT